MPKEMPLEKKIKREEIPALIEQISKRGARPFTVFLRTEKPLLKKNRATHKAHAYGHYVTKFSHLQTFLNVEYGNSVNLQLNREEKEPNFQSKGGWFRHSDPLARSMVCLPGEKCNYIQLKVEKRLSEKFVSEEGKTLQKRWIENLLPKRTKPANQGTDKTILTICPKLDSIMAFVCDGVKYVVE